MKNLQQLIVLLLLTATTKAQQPQFILQGKVEYERKTNMHAFFGEGSWAKEMRTRYPQFRTSYFDLVFDSSHSIWQAGREIPDDKYKNFWMNAGLTDTKYFNFTTGQTTQLKEVFEKNYLMQDSMLQIEWKMTEETRNIAGFECRKAVGKFMDSLYVIAFFTDQILSPAGPESFNGLPGLVLGAAFPRIHTTWFATKLQLQQVTPAQMPIPAKGKKATRGEILNTVRSATKNWGEESQINWIQAII